MDTMKTHESGGSGRLARPRNEELSARISATLELVPDFPSPNVQFQDMAAFYADPDVMGDTAAVMDEFGGDFDAVVAIEARGFPIGALVAQRAGSPLVLARKRGKLPGETVGIEYDLEYGSAVLEIQTGVLGPRARTLVIDDVLATGGTLEAAARLVEICGASVCGCAAILEIAALGGRQRLAPRSVFTAHAIT